MSRRIDNQDPRRAAPDVPSSDAVRPLPGLPQADAGDAAASAMLVRKSADHPANALAQAARRFADSEAYADRNVGSGMAPIAAMAAAASDTARAALLYRISFARGERDFATVHALRRINASLLGRRLAVTATLKNKQGNVLSRQRICTVADLQALLQGRFTSRLTLADAVDLLSIGSPPVRLEGIELCARELEPGAFALEIEGCYAGLAATREGLYYNVTLVLKDGVPEIVFRNIAMAAGLRRRGLGAASICAALQFAALHGIPSWTEFIHEEGVLAWPSLGGRINEEGLRHTHHLLLELLEMRAIRPEALAAIDAADIQSITSFLLPQHAVADTAALHSWIKRHTGMKDEAIAALQPPYAVGRVAADVASFTATYDVEPLLKRMANEYLPERAARLRAKAERSAGREALIDTVTASWLEELARRAALSQEVLADVARAEAEVESQVEVKAEVEDVMMAAAFDDGSGIMPASNLFPGVGPVMSPKVGR